MKNAHVFRCSNGTEYRFRNLHPAESLVGRQGIIALSIEHNFEVQPIQFVAFNDLGQQSIQELRKSPAFEECLAFGSLSMAVHIMPRASYRNRARTAKALNDQIELTFWTSEAA